MKSIAAGASRFLLPALIGLALATSAAAQTPWKPIKPIRLVVPFAAGGATDSAARGLAERLEKVLGQPAIVDNRPGAGGLIGTQAVLNAQPDGYTFLIGTVDTQALNPNVYANLSFHPEALLPVASVAQIGTVLAGRKGAKPTSMRELVEIAKTGAGNYGHWGIGGLAHAAGELLKTQAGMPTLQAIPFQGSAPGLQALLGGQIDVMFLPMTIALSSGDRLDILGLAAAQRFDGMKALPTMAEAGFPLEADTWVGVFAPPATPKAIVDAMHAAVNEVVTDPAIARRWLDLGIAAVPSKSPADYALFVNREQAKWGQVIRTAGIKLSQ